MKPVNETRRKKMLESVKLYFEACNSASRELFAQILAEDCIHYFPPETGGPYYGRDAIANLWIGFVRDKDSRWTIDREVCDGNEICIEWTHWKLGVGEHIRGSEWYEFGEDGKINAIWAHYASPRDPARVANELEGFKYEKHGYPLQAPQLSRETHERRTASLQAEEQRGS